MSVRCNDVIVIRLLGGFAQQPGEKYKPYVYGRTPTGPARGFSCNPLGSYHRASRHKHRCLLHCTDEGAGHADPNLQPGWDDRCYTIMPPVLYDLLQGDSIGVNVQSPLVVG